MAVVNDLCTTVGAGSVGETGGPSSEVSHVVDGPTSKVMVVRNVGSSLCPNTGAMAILLANGAPVEMGDITAVGNAIQKELRPGTRVTAVVQTFGLNNGILCPRLGVLQYKLRQCELEAEAPARGESSVIHPGHIATRNWYAWNDLQPPKPDVFHIVGEVQVPNPGVNPMLVPKVPPGFNHRILLLDLILVQLPGNWPQMVTWKPVQFSRVNVTYDSVDVYYRNELVVTVPVDDIQ
ncbi:MAG: hypothetical protein WD845_07360 [Pirellulales bacterium]